MLWFADAFRLWDDKPVQPHEHHSEPLLAGGYEQAGVAAGNGFMVNRAVLISLCGLALGLVLGLFFEYRALRPTLEVSVAPIARQSSPPQASAALPHADHSQEWVSTILARPLFSPTRRPPAAAMAGGAAAVGLPRLSGVLIAGTQKRAIFGGPAGGKTLIVAEGARVGDYAVQSIVAGVVTLAGPDGPLVLTPTFDRSAARAAGQPVAPAPDPDATPAELGQKSLLNRLLNAPPNQRSRP